MFWSPAISLQHRTISYFFSCQTRVERERLSSAWKPIWEKTGRGLSFFGAYKTRGSFIVMSSRFLRTCFIVPCVIVKFHWASSNRPSQGEGPPVWQCQVFLRAGMPWVYCVMHPENHLVLWNQEQMKAPWLRAMHGPLLLHSLTLDFRSYDFRPEGHFALSPSFTVLRPESSLKVTVRTHFHKCSFDARWKICKPAYCVIKWS